MLVGMIVVAVDIQGVFLQTDGEDIVVVVQETLGLKVAHNLGGSLPLVIHFQASLDLVED